MGISSPSRPSSSLSNVMQLPMLGLTADVDDSRCFDSARLPAFLIPRLPSAQSSNSSLSLRFSDGARCTFLTFSSPSPGPGNCRSLSQSSSRFLFDFFLPRRLIDPPTKADAGMLVGIGMPANLADDMAWEVVR